MKISDPLGRRYLPIWKSAPSSLSIRGTGGKMRIVSLMNLNRRGYQDSEDYFHTPFCELHRIHVVMCAVSVGIAEDAVDLLKNSQ